MTIYPATDPAAAFDAAFRTLAPALDCRLEDGEGADRDFLTDLFVACSPLGAWLPAPMLLQQAAIRHDAYRRGFPQAMRRIVTRDSTPIGRLIIDWQPGDAPRDTHCVDIAVLPEARGTRAGPLLLAAWLAVADARGLTARLEVDATNPALRLYTRLGFVADADQDPHDPMVTMHRPMSLADG